MSPLNVHIHPQYIDYSTPQPIVDESGMVLFINHTDNAIYLAPSDGRPCPFSENWPQCIPAGQTVVRQLLSPLYLSGSFTFRHFSLHSQHQSVGVSEQQRVQEPKDDGEIIVE